MHKHLRSHRFHAGLSLDELGRRAAIERSKLSRAERGYVRLRPDEVRRVARALRVRITDLLGQGR
jgi:transcriptional regulator with XRE-family HTH domain